jgi:hypothetical protein
MAQGHGLLGNQPLELGSNQIDGQLVHGLPHATRTD